MMSHSALQRAAILGALGTLLLASCGTESVEEAREPAVRPVKLITLQASNSLESRTFPAVIDVIQSSDLAFQVGGQIEELAVTEAQEVEQGQILARLDQRDYINQLTTAQAQFDNAEAEYQRAERLYEEDAIARSVLEQRESQLNVARAALDSANKALSDTVMIAPYNGVVSETSASRLDNVPAGQVIISIFGNSAMEAKVNIPAGLVARAPDGDDYQGASFVILDAVPEVPIPAVFREANLQADVASQTYGASFAFTAPEDLNILPGMNASIILELPEFEDAAADDFVSVPLAAVMSEGEMQFTWVVDPESMTVTRKAITVEEGIGEFLSVSSGLTVGDIIVGAGASYLSEGMEVRAWTD